MVVALCQNRSKKNPGQVTVQRHLFSYDSRRPGRYQVVLGDYDRSTLDGSEVIIDVSERHLVSTENNKLERSNTVCVINSARGVLCKQNNQLTVES